MINMLAYNQFTRPIFHKEGDKLYIKIPQNETVIREHGGKKFLDVVWLNFECKIIREWEE